MLIKLWENALRWKAPGPARQAGQIFTSWERNFSLGSIRDVMDTILNGFFCIRNTFERRWTLFLSKAAHSSNFMALKARPQWGEEQVVPVWTEAIGPYSISERKSEGRFMALWVTLANREPSALTERRIRICKPGSWVSVSMLLIEGRVYTFWNFHTCQSWGWFIFSLKSQEMNLCAGLS